MKKIFVIEINDKDKNIDNEEVVNELEQYFNDFSQKITNNKKIYIRFKRVGSNWQNILNNLNKNNNNSNKVIKETIKVKKSNHLKIVK